MKLMLLSATLFGLSIACQAPSVSSTDEAPAILAEPVVISLAAGGVTCPI